jgi:hypothetical protein
MLEVNFILWPTPTFSMNKQKQIYITNKIKTIMIKTNHYTVDFFVFSYVLLLEDEK